MSSPWGKIDRVTKIVSGISFVSTPSHGGLRVSKRGLKYLINPELVTRLGGQVMGNYVFFEEDCAASLFLFDAPSVLKMYAFQIGQDPNVLFESFKLSVSKWYPDYFKEVV